MFYSFAIVVVGCFESCACDDREDMSLFDVRSAKDNVQANVDESSKPISLKILFSFFHRIRAC